LLGIAAADNSINSIQYLIPKLESLLQEYIIFGGYPKVVISENQEEKIRILQDITSSYILKDIRNLFRIEKIDNLNHLIRFLSVNIGKELNIHTLSVDTGLHRETVINYLNILEASYIIKRLSPFHTNLGTELKKMPKVYFVDTGIRNILLENLNPLEIRTDKGELLENYVFNALLHQKDLLTQLNYWKTRNKQEVDFVLSNANSIKAYEVKYGSNKTNSFQTFRVSYPQAICQYIRFAIQDEDVKSVPAWLL
jgi:predicted AAA+ superfamily ATPase